jgi:RNA polymerase sigma factor (sigma-70 family)
MAGGRLGPILEHIRHLLGVSSAASLTDGQLVKHFVARQDEAAFAALFQRHGPMVLGVCRRVLHDPQDVEDAFQATFLVLVRKADSILKEESVASWLYGVAYRTAVRARAQRNRRHAREKPMMDVAREPPPAAEDGRELRPVLDDVLHGLPEKYRAPLVLHYLDGKTKGETAQQLGWTEGTVSGRLARGRQLLRTRLARRGVSLAGALAALEGASSGASAALPLALAEATLQSALGFLSQPGAAAAGSGRVVALAEGVIRQLFLTKVKLRVGLLAAFAALATGAVLVAHAVVATPATRPPVPASRPAREPDRQDRAAQTPRAKDLQGDPLPPAVRARLGTNRGRHGRNLSALEFAQDGRRLATRAEDGTVRLWDAVTGDELHVFRGEAGTPGARFWCFAFPPAGRQGPTLVTGGGDGMVRFWDLATGRQLRRVRGNPVGVRSLAFSTDGKVLAIAGEDNRVSIWDPEAWKEIWCLCPANPDPRPEATHLPVKEVRFAPDGKTLAVFRLPLGGWANAYFQSTLELWDVATGRPRYQLKTTSLQAPAFMPDGKALVCREAAGTVWLRELATGRPVRVYAGTESGSRTVAVDGDGRALAVALEGAVRLYDLATGKKGRTLEDSAGMALLAFARDGRTLAGGRDDGTFQVWNAATGRKLLKPLPGHRGNVSCVAYSPDGRILATGGAFDGTIRLWQASTGQEIRCWEDKQKKGRARPWPMSLAFSADGKTLASVGSDRMVRLREVSTGNEIRQFRAGAATAAYPTAFRFSPDGTLLATPDAGGAVHVWMVTGKEIHRLPTADQPPTLGTFWGLAFSADGKFLAASRGKAVFVWETATGREVRQFVNADTNVAALALSADSRLLAAAGSEDTVRLWEVATGKERCLLGKGDLPDRLDPNGTRIPYPTAGNFTALVFSPDGKTLFGGRMDGAVYVWDLARDRPAGKVCEHKETISALALSPDGKALASASGDSTVLLWDVAALKSLAR